MPIKGAPFVLLFPRLHTSSNLRIFVAMISRLISLVIAIVLVTFSLLAQVSADASRAYGIRIWDEVGSPLQLVSFDVRNPGMMTAELNLDFHSVRAATGFENDYYLFCSSDEYGGLQTEGLYHINLLTKEVTAIANYDIFSYENELILLDATYDDTRDRILALAYNVDNVEIDGSSGEISAKEVGLYEFDPYTGRASLISTHDKYDFVAIAYTSDDDKLVALTSAGALWTIHTETGRHRVNISTTKIAGFERQSLAFDPGDGILYRAGFARQYEVDYGYFAKYTIRYASATYNRIDLNQDNAHIIGLHIDDSPTHASAPAAVGNLEVVPDKNGNASASISWTNPSTLYNGSPLAGAFKVRIYRNGVIIHIVEHSQLGERISYVDEGFEGLARYKVVCQNDYGEGVATYSTTVFIGVDVPGAVGDIHISKKSNNCVALSWSAPAKGKNDGWFDSASLKYDITRYPEGDMVAENIVATSFEDNTIADTRGYYYIIRSKNDAGMGLEASSATIVAGPALPEPYFCDFVDDLQAALWSVFDCDGDGQTWQRRSGEAAFMCYDPEQLEASKPVDDWMISAPIDLKAGKNYVLRYSMYIKLYSLFPVSYRIAYGSAIDPEAMTTVLVDQKRSDNNGSRDYVDHAVFFSVPADGEYCFGFEALNSVYSQFTNIAIEEHVDTDLGIIDFSATPAVIVGDKVDFEIEISNGGSLPIDGYDVAVVDDDGTSLVAAHVDETIAPGEHATIALDYNTAEAENLKLRAQVVAVGDGKEGNNLSAKQLDVAVLPDGSWCDFANGAVDTFTTPFNLYSSHSAIQTIYTKDMIAGEKCKIDGIMYYYTLLDDRAVGSFSAKIYLANTSQDVFAANRLEPIDISEFTPVFDGTISLATRQNAVFIPFSTRFDYAGENICVFTVQENDGTCTGVRWIEFPDSEGLKFHMLSYRGSTPFTFAEAMMGFNDLANISFYRPTVVDSVSDVLLDDSDAPVEWYNLHGQRLDATSLTPGIYIRRQGSKTTKVVL